MRIEHVKGPVLACKIHQVNKTHARAFRLLILLHLINKQSHEILWMYINFPIKEFSPEFGFCLQ